MQRIKQLNKYLVFLFLIIFCIFQYGIRKICGFTLYPDEFGYWASAAGAVGYDWSEVASMGSYYSFGYSLILTPVLKLFTDGIAAYRAAIAINMTFMCVGAFLLWNLLSNIYPQIDETKRALICGIAVLYPSWIFYMQMTMAEAMLYFLFILITYLLFKLITKTKGITAVLLAVILIYIYCVHMRSVGVVIACSITVFLWGVTDADRRKKLFLFLTVLGAAMLLAIWLKQLTQTWIYTAASKEALAGNDYGSQWDKLRMICSLKGIKQFLEGILGKIYYLGMASFGIFYWALAWMAKEIVCLVKRLIKKESIQVIQWIALFLFLSAVGEVLISSIFMYRSTLIDTLVYGRYSEFIMPVILLIGIVIMLQSRFLLPVTLLLGIGNGLLTVKILNIINQRSLSGLRGYHVPGISYLIKEEDLRVELFFRNTWVMIMLIMVGSALLIWLCRRWKSTSWILAGFLVIQIILGMQISSHYTYRMNRANFEARYVSDAILENYEEGNHIVYLDEGTPEFIDFIQMQLGKKSISVVSLVALSEEILQDDMPEFMVTSMDTQMDEKFSQLYDQKITGMQFNLYYQRRDQES